MNSSTRNTLLALGLVALAVLGGGCFSSSETIEPSDKGRAWPKIEAEANSEEKLAPTVENSIESQQEPEPTVSWTTSTGVLIEIGADVSFMVPRGWHYQKEVSQVGEIVYIYDCEKFVNIGSLFCEKDLYVAEAQSGPEALLEYSKKSYDFAWYCPNNVGTECLSDEGKLSQIEKKDKYWTTSSIGIAENAAIAFRHNGKYIVLFGFEDAESLYRTYQPLLRN